MEYKEIIDPRNNTQMEGCVFYRWLLDEKKYEFIYDDDCVVDDIYPEIKINILNENKLWLQENLRFQIDSKYDSYKYCVGKNECEIDNEYKGTTTVEKDGKNIYVCAVGYFGDVPGKSTCVGPYNVDTVSPEITSNKVTYTSSKIVVNATCSDATSLVKEIKYSINGGEYQESNLFTNLKTGEYKVKTKCIDNALNESEVEETVELKMSAPTIAQVSQTPSGTYAQKRVIRITYNSTNVESPKYYYSLDNKTWTEVTTTTKDIEFTSNGYLYAKTVDNAGNVASAATFTVTNVDSTKPSTSIAISNVKTDRVTVTATCSDNESKISKYEFSKDNGTTWINNGTTASYTFTGLTQGTSYTYKVRCTNGSGITNEASSAESTSSITKPTIAQVSQTPSSGTYAQKRVIRITYNGTGIENPKYYYSLDGSTWTEVTTTTKDIEFTSNGYLYAKTVDNAGNTASAAAYTVVNVDSTKPSTSIAVSNVKTDRATITATCADSESSIAKYEFSKDNGSTWTANGTTASYTFTGLTQGTSYTYKVRCTNGSGITNEASSAGSTSSITKPTIAQVSQTPSSGEWAQKRVIRITYSGANVESPKYYYSLDGSTWTEVTTTTKDIEFTSNGYLYAKTTDPKGNVASAATFTVTNIDTTAPSTSIATSVKTDRATVTATCADSESSIAKYEYSKDGGSTWTANGTTASYTFTGLTQGTSYTFVIRCTNGSGLTKTASGAKSTATIAAPTIAQASQSPSSGTYAQSRVIKITYTATNIQTPEYYFKSSVAATVASGVVTHACGTSTNPGTCSASSVTTLAANTWYKTSSTTPSITYTQNGYLYAQTWDPADNTAAASTFTITNVDTAAPTVNVAVSETTATITLSDNMQLAGYAVNTSSTAVSSWTSVTGTSASESWTATEAGTYYAWVKDASGRTEKYEFKIEESAFCPYEIGQTFEFAYTGDIQEFIAQCDGEYKLEVWGASGGKAPSGQIESAKGGYSSGFVELSKNENLYINVGGQGECTEENKKVTLGGYNGGGNGYWETASSGISGRGCGGGGATHVATSTGLLSSLENNKDSILLVAGGGGGNGYKYGWDNSGTTVFEPYAGGYGGGQTGGSGNVYSGSVNTGGTQTAGGKAGSYGNSGTFGLGGNSYNDGLGSGGGGGYYGGSGSYWASAGGGGSGYIGSVTNGVIVAGNTFMPTHDGTTTMIGNPGNGYAKITYIGKDYTDEGTYICKRATTLHTETCAQTNTTYYCSGAGYTASGSKKTTTITYGNLGIVGTFLSSGDAFDCDVNGDGIYDATTERFYYVSDLYDTTSKEFNNDYAVLIYYNNTIKGLASTSGTAYDSNNINYKGPVTAITNLPTMTQWSNVSLYKTSRAIMTETGTTSTSGGTLPTTFSYAGYAARLLTAQEVNKACNITVGSYTNGELDECNYLFENTKYSNSSMPTHGHWLETPYKSYTNTAWNAYGYTRSAYCFHNANVTYHGVRPAIEVLKTDIQI